MNISITLHAQERACVFTLRPMGDAISVDAEWRDRETGAARVLSLLLSEREAWELGEGLALVRKAAGYPEE